MSEAAPGAQGMAPASFTSWRLSMGFSPQAASDALGVHMRTIQRYEAGSLPIPLAVHLACRYLTLRNTLLPLLA